MGSSPQAAEFSGVDSSQAAASFRVHPPAPEGSSMGSSKTTCTVFSMSYKGICPGAWDTSSPPSSLNLLSTVLLLSYFSHSSQLLCRLFVLSKLFSQRCHQCSRLSQLCPVVGPFWSWLVLALTQGSPWPLLTDTTLAAPRLTTPGHGHSIQHLL